MRINLLSPLFAVLAIAGCSTPYQEMGFTGGVSAAQVTATSFRISARGNGYTEGTAIQDFALLKAAETTKRAGGTHFLVVSAADASSAGYVETSGHAETSYVGNRAYTTFTPASVHEYVKPGQDMYIRVLTVSSGAPPPGALSADEIIQFVGSRIKRG